MNRSVFGDFCDYGISETSRFENEIYSKASCLLHDCIENVFCCKVDDLVYTTEKNEEWKTKKLKVQLVSVEKW